MAQTLVQFLQESADTFGDRTALLFKPTFRYQKWSYAQLWEQSGRVAFLLQQKGLKKGDRAILWAYNCPQWVLAFFGCMRAGVIAVPLDLRSTGDFAERVASKTRPRLMFVSRLTPPSYQELDTPKVYVEDLEDSIKGLPEPANLEVTPTDLAEIMFTSGTTGDPKGVMLSHGNILSNVEAASQHIPGKPSYRLLSILPLSHMFEQMACLLMALRCGANITYPNSRQPSVLFRTMRERKVTTMLLVPQALDLFMKGIEREVRRQGKEPLWNSLLKVSKYTPFQLRRLLFRRVHQQFGGSLDFIISGGAALDPELGAKWKLLGVKVIQGYGTTEASPVISCNTLKDPRFDSVGLPLPGVEVRIAKDGEILVRGPNITSGYWEAPEQTAAVLDDGWYKTGDLGFIDEQGYLHIKGRKKDMIALADGQKVFPEDIEAVLRKHPSVTDVIVVGLPKGSGVEVHAVFLQTDQSSASQVVTWANSQLEERQQIMGFSLWHENDFPRTHTLKVKKGVVIDALRGVVPTSPAAIAPSGNVPNSGERSLTQLICEIGSLPPVQVTSDKALGLDLNLDSLKRVELLSTIEEELGVYVDESQISPNTTIQQLQGMIAQGVRTASTFKFPAWGKTWWCRFLRDVLQRAILFPLLAPLYRLRVTGQENLRGLPSPVLFAANQHLPLHNGLIMKAIPLEWRRRLAIAAWSELFRSRRNAFFGPLLGNSFPFAKEGAVRASLDNVGCLLDEGWSVLIYPEGELTVGGPLKPFKGGTGLLAIEGRLPIVPIRLCINQTGSPETLPFRKRGDVEIRFGKPLIFSPKTPYMDATQTIEDAVRAL